MADVKEKNTNKDAVMAKVVRTILANERAASAKTKKRGEVSGGGKKPWRQKGTGRARVGSNRSPIWRGGGIVFGPTGEQNFQLKTNRKEREIAQKSAMDAKKAVTKTLSVPVLTKTKQAAKLLKDNKIEGKVLLLANAGTDVVRIKKYFKNIPNVLVREAGKENTYEIMNADVIVIFDAPASIKTEKKATEKVAPKEGKKQVKTAASGKGREA